MENKKASYWERKPDLPVVFLFLVLLAVFYWKVLSGQSIFVFVDASRFFYPLWKWGAGVLVQGFIPLWNPDAQFGAPYFADPQMAFAYPPVPLFYSCFNPTNAFAALIIFHHLWALLGFWFFARAEGFSAKASLLGSFAFGFSLHLVCSSWTPVALMTISWLPWVFNAAGKIFRNEKSGLFYLSFAWAMQLSAGYPVLVYLTGLSLLFHFAWKTKIAVVARSDRRIDGRLRRGNLSLENFMWLGWFALAGLIATAYNLVWGLPFAEFLGQSNYENGAGKFHDLTWKDLGTALSPFLQGHPLLQDYHGPHYWVSTYYIGLPILCLLLWGGVRRVYQKTSPVLLVVFLVLSLGILGAGKILKAILPGYSLVVHSGFWISILLLFAAWMAMESLEAFLNRKESDNGKWFWIGSVVSIYAASFFLQAPLYPGDFWFSIALLVLAVFLRPVFLRWGCLLAAMVLSLGSAADGLNILLERDYYEKPPVVLSALPKPGRFFFTPPLMRDAAKLQGATMAGAYEAAKQKLYPNWPLSFGREQAPLYNTIQLKSSFAWTFQAFQYSVKHSRAVLDYLNVRYLFGKNQFKDFKKIKFPPELGEISENQKPLEKWFSVEKLNPSGATLENDFLRADRELVNYGKICFVEDASKAGLYHPRKVIGSSPLPNHVLVTAEGSGRSFLASSETNYPGWRALVEAKGQFEMRPLELVNHAFRGLVLSDGENKVLMVYGPMTFRLGLFLSLLVCSLWAGLFLKRIRT